MAFQPPSVSNRGFIGGLLLGYAASFERKNHGKPDWRRCRSPDDAIFRRTTALSNEFLDGTQPSLAVRPAGILPAGCCPRSGLPARLNKFTPSLSNFPATARSSNLVFHMSSRITRDLESRLTSVALLLRGLRSSFSALFFSALLVATATAQAPEMPWLYTKARALPKYLTNQGSGYFSIVEGKNGRLYIGTAKYGEDAYLVEYDPVTQQMRTVVDAMREIGSTGTGFAAQSKIHTRNNVGASGRIYFGTKQGYPDKKKDEKFTDYPGGYPMVFDPQTNTTRVYPIPEPHHGIISIAPDESRKVAYISTCSDERPVESSHFLKLDLETGKYQDFGETNHMYAFIVVDFLGRAYHPLRGGDILRYDPKTDKVERLQQTIDGQPPVADSHLADEFSHPINWEISPNRKTLFAVAMSGNQLYSYDLAIPGDVLAGRSLGKLYAGAETTDCRALCVAPNGTVWAAISA